MDLKRYLFDINMSIKDFSEILDVHSKYMSRIINGHVKPGKRLAKEIEKVTDGLVKIEFSTKRLDKQTHVKSH